MDGNRSNARYLITASIPVGNVEFVLGVNKKEEQYVTWECRNKTEYSFGHYTDSLLFLGYSSLVRQYGDDHILV